MIITVSKADRGRFHAHLGGRHLCTSDTPFFSAARVLKAEGVHYNEPLTMAWEGSEVVAMRSTVGVAASLTVSEGNRGTRFTAYRPSPFARPE